MYQIPNISVHGGQFAGGRGRKREQTGTATSGTTNTTFTSSTSGSSFQRTVTVTGLKFLPSKIIIRGSTSQNWTYYDSGLTNPANTNTVQNMYGAPISVTATGFTLPWAGVSAETVTWEAFE